MYTVYRGNVAVRNCPSLADGDDGVSPPADGGARARCASQNARYILAVGTATCAALSQCRFPGAKPSGFFFPRDPSMSTVSKEDNLGGTGRAAFRGDPGLWIEIANRISILFRDSAGGSSGNDAPHDRPPPACEEKRQCQEGGTRIEKQWAEGLESRGRRSPRPQEGMGKRSSLGPAHCKTLAPNGNQSFTTADMDTMNP